MEIVKLVIIGILGSVVGMMLKKEQPQYSVLVVLSTGIAMLIIIVTSLQNVILSFNSVVVESGINTELFSGILKIIGVGYVTEYSASICEDLGSRTIGEKLQLAGKITIFLMSLPILLGLVKIINDIII